MQTWRETDAALPGVSACNLGVEVEGAGSCSDENDAAPLGVDGGGSCTDETDAVLLGVEVEAGSCSAQADACPTSSKSSPAAHSRKRSASVVTSPATVASSSVT